MPSTRMHNFPCVQLPLHREEINWPSEAMMDWSECGEMEWSVKIRQSLLRASCVSMGRCDFARMLVPYGRFPGPQMGVSSPLAEMMGPLQSGPLHQARHRRWLQRPPLPIQSWSLPGPQLADILVQHP